MRLRGRTDLIKLLKNKTYIFEITGTAPARNLRRPVFGRPCGVGVRNKEAQRTVPV